MRNARQNRKGLRVLKSISNPILIFEDLYPKDFIWIDLGSVLG